MTTATIPELAAKAADKIRRDGWLQGDLFEAYEDEETDEIVPVDNCAVCLLGACAVARWDNPAKGYHADEAYDQFLNVVATEIRQRAGVHLELERWREPGSDSTFLITAYNDYVATMADDVLAVLDAVAAG